MSLKELNRDLRVVNKYKMGYPSSVSGVLYVKFTEEGVDVKKKDQEGYEPFLDHKQLGIVPESLAGLTINNMGSTFDQTRTRRMECKHIEQQVIYILAEFFGIPRDIATGYVTNGTTEGNFVSLWWSRKYLNYKNPNSKRCVLFTSVASHYSVAKTADQLSIEMITVPLAPNYGMDISAFQDLLSGYLTRHSDATVMVSVTLGTTVHGGSDDLIAIRGVLESKLDRKRFTIHVDAALLAITLPILKPFDDVQNYLGDLGVDTLAFCAHKFFGTPQVAGIVLTTTTFLDEAFGGKANTIEYLGKIRDVSFTGSRPGFYAIAFYSVLLRLDIHTDSNRLKKTIYQNLNNAKYLYEQLGKYFDPDLVLWIPNQFSVVFPRPSDIIMRKYHIMSGPSHTASVCILLNVNKELIDEFISDIKLEIAFHHGISVEPPSFVTGIYPRKYTCKIINRSSIPNVKELLRKTPNHSFSHLTPDALEQLCVAVADSGICMLGENPVESVCCFFVEDYTLQLPFVPSAKPPSIEKRVNTSTATISFICIRDDSEQWIVEKTLWMMLQKLKQYSISRVLCNFNVHRDITKLLAKYNPKLDGDTLCINLEQLKIETAPLCSHL